MVYSDPNKVSQTLNSCWKLRWRLSRFSSQNPLKIWINRIHSDLRTLHEHKVVISGVKNTLLTCWGCLDIPCTSFVLLMNFKKVCAHLSAQQTLFPFCETLFFLFKKMQRWKIAKLCRAIDARYCTGTHGAWSVSQVRGNWFFHIFNQPSGLVMNS